MSFDSTTSVLSNAAVDWLAYDRALSEASCTSTAPTSLAPDSPRPDLDSETVALEEQSPRVVCSFGFAKSPDQVAVGVLPAGSFNRVLRIDTPQGSFVLRAPKISDWQPLHDLKYSQANLAALQQALPDVSLPSILFSTTEKGLLGTPFAIMPCMPGYRLEDHYYKMTQQQKLHLAGEIAELQHKIWRVQPQAIGPLWCTADTKKLHVGHFDHTAYWKSGVRETDLLPASTDIYHSLHERFELLDHQGFDFPNAREPLQEVVAWLKRRGRLSGRIVLCHDDIYPRNLLIDDPESFTPKITAVLDWDLVKAAPVEYAFQLPTWLWQDAPRVSRTPYFDRPVSPFDAFEGDRLDLQPQDMGHLQVKQHFLERIRQLEPDFEQIYNNAQSVMATTLFTIAMTCPSESCIGKIDPYNEWFRKTHRIRESNARRWVREEMVETFARGVRRFRASTKKRPHSPNVAE